MNLYIQYGCGLSAPAGWKNYDASPTLRLQRLPLIGKLIQKVDFPSAVLYGDIISGLPGISEESCDGVFCSHVLEHLSLEDFRRALHNTFTILKQGGIFRCILPDLEANINAYNAEKAAGDPDASLRFLDATLLGIRNRPSGFKEKIISLFGNSHHLWMWDKYSLQKELKAVGFSNIRLCKFNDSTDKHFTIVEEESRYYNAIAFEAIR